MVGGDRAIPDAPSGRRAATSPSGGGNGGGSGVVLLACRSGDRDAVAMGWVAGSDNVNEWVDGVPVGTHAQQYLSQVTPYYESASEVLGGG
jgi:hypothetical protein